MKDCLLVVGLACCLWVGLGVGAKPLSVGTPVLRADVLETPPVSWPVRLGQFGAAVLLAGGAVWWYRRRRKPEK